MTLFGATINGELRKSMPDLHKQVQVVRVYAQSLDRPANSDPDFNVFGSQAMVAGSHTADVSPAKADAYFTAMDPALKKRISAWCPAHEPENPKKGLDPTWYRNYVADHSKVLHKHGIRCCVNLMGWTFEKNSDRDWKAWCNQTPGVVDLLAADAYNSGHDTGNFKSAEAMYGLTKAAAGTLGIPFAFWEAGTSVVKGATEAEHAAAAKSWRDWMIANKAEHGIWFDRVGTSSPDWDGRIQRKTAEVWLAPQVTQPPEDPHLAEIASLKAQIVALNLTVEVKERLLVEALGVNTALANRMAQIAALAQG